MENSERDIIDRLARWAGEQALIRALLWTSSRTNPQAPVDRLSDYDIIVVAADIRPFITGDAWVRWYGAPLVLFRDNRVSDGIEWWTRLVLYEDGVKIDYTIWRSKTLRAVRDAPHLPGNLDVGYRVLVDKDGLTQGLHPPTYTAYILRRPTEAEFLALVEEFWWETTYVAKNLWRDDLYPAKYNVEVVIRADVLRRMLEWYIETRHDWSLKTGVLGRGFKRLLPPDIWGQVESTFAGADIEENWAALFRTCDLFRTVASAVAADLGFEYPWDLDRRMMSYLSGVKDLGE